MKVTGAQALFKSLEGEGVDIVFGIPGGAILPAYDPLLDSSVRHVLCRHEQGAGHAAEGYAWATGKVGVAMATSGPGGCNLVTALADAKMDSVPMVAITGQVPTPGRRQRRVPGGRHHRHHDAGHEAQHARHGPGRGRRGDPRGVPHRADRPARPGPRRPPEGRARQRDDVEVAGRREPARLQAHDEGQRPPDRRGREAHHEGEAPGALRRRRRDQGRRVEGAVQAGDERAAAGRHHADGARRVPRLARALPGHARHARQLHRRHRDAEGRPAGRARRALRRPRHRQARRVRAGRQGHPRGHRPGRDRQEPRGRGADRRRLQGRDRQARARDRQASGRGRRRSRPDGLARPARGVEAGVPVRATTSSPTARSSRSSASSGSATRPTRTRSSSRASGSTRCGRRSSGTSRSRAAGSTPAAWARWASRCRRRSARRPACRTSA